MRFSQVRPGCHPGLPFLPPAHKIPSTLLPRELWNPAPFLHPQSQASSSHTTLLIPSGLRASTHSPPSIPYKSLLSSLFQWFPSSLKIKFKLPKMVESLSDLIFIAISSLILCYSASLPFVLQIYLGIGYVSTSDLCRNIHLFGLEHSPLPHTCLDNSYFSFKSQLRDPIFQLRKLGLVSLPHVLMASSTSPPQLDYTSLQLTASPFFLLQPGRCTTWNLSYSPLYPQLPEKTLAHERSLLPICQMLEYMNE